MLPFLPSIWIYMTLKSFPFPVQRFTLSLSFPVFHFGLILLNYLCDIFNEVSSDSLENHVNFSLCFLPKIINFFHLILTLRIFQFFFFFFTKGDNKRKKLRILNPRRKGKNIREKVKNWVFFFLMSSDRRVLKVSCKWLKR